MHYNNIFHFQPPAKLSSNARSDTLVPPPADLRRRTRPRDGPKSGIRGMSPAMPSERGRGAPDSSAGRPRARRC